MPRTDAETIGLLDLGTAKTTLLVLQIHDDRLVYAGHATVASMGIRKGLVVQLDAAVATIRRAMEAVEQQAGVALDSVFVSLNGAHVRGLSGQAGISLTSRSREITRDDIHRVLDLARNVSMPEDREIIFVGPQEFVLDQQPGVHDPTGMLATRMEARVYMITVSSGAMKNLVWAVQKAGLAVDEVIFGPLGVSEASLSAEEREAGVAVLEIGAGSTGILAYQRGTVHYAGAIPVGGDHFTNDIAVGFHTTPGEAEKIKRKFGFASYAHARGHSMIEVPGFRGRPARMLSHQQLGDCILPRAEELVEMIGADLERAGLLGALGAGLVLSGGGSQLPGLRDLAEERLGLPVRMAQPELIEAMPDEFAAPEYAFLVGAGYYAHRVIRRAVRPESFWNRLMTRLNLAF